MGRVLVTGGCGFIGRHVVRALLDRGEDVVVADVMIDQSRPELPPPTVGFYGGYSGDGLLWQTVKDVDRVIHLAARVGVGQSMYEPGAYVRANTLDTARMLEHLDPRRIRRLVVASSMSCYGEGALDLFGESMPTAELTALRPTSVYAITKRDQEELCLTLGAAKGIPTCALRFFNVYGPGQALGNPYTGITSIFATRLLNSERPVVFEDGQQRRDFVHVSDVVRAVLAALDSDHRGPVNVCTGRYTTVEMVALLVADALGSRLEPEITGQRRAGDIRHCYGDPSLARSALGFEARVRFPDGIRELAESIREAYRYGGLPVDRHEKAMGELERAGLVS